MISDTYKVKLELDPETFDLILPIPDAMLQQLGWGLNDEIRFTQNEDGTLTLERNDA